jgi:hypothetical protein
MTWIPPGAAEKATQQGCVSATRAVSRPAISAKDYVFMPALSMRRWRRTLAANLTANTVRNLWVYVNIICGHIPGGAETFDPAVVKDETKGEW